MKPGDFVKIKSMEKSRDRLVMVILQVDRSAPEKPYYCYNEQFDFADWFEGDDLVKLKSK